MEFFLYPVFRKDNTIDLCKRFNITIQQLVLSNYLEYPSLLKDPYMIFENWTLKIPQVAAGGNIQYALK